MGNQDGRRVDGVIKLISDLISKEVTW